MVKILQFFVNSVLRIQDGEIQIRDKHPRSATLEKIHKQQQGRKQQQDFGIKEVGR
jgi:hypothetical protein